MVFASDLIDDRNKRSNSITTKVMLLNRCTSIPIVGTRRRDVRAAIRDVRSFVSASVSPSFAPQRVKSKNL